MKLFRIVGFSALLLGAAPATSFAQTQAPPAAIPSCNYVKDQLMHYYCNAGNKTVAIPLAAGSVVTYTVGYPADTPTVYFTAHPDPFDPSANNAIGISVYDQESGSSPRAQANMSSSPLPSHNNTFQLQYQTGMGSPLVIQLFNYWSKPVTMYFDQSGLMYGDYYNENAIFLAQPASPAQAAAPNCQFSAGFKDLHDMDPNDIGDCTENQTTMSNGDAQQHTTKGLLVYRKADNWTGFTNGAYTWLKGPSGIAFRANDYRFPWEASS